MQAVREAVGPDMALRVDANDHYRPADAIRLIRSIERFDPEHVEQPIPRGDLLGLAAVQATVGVPLMTDDSVATVEDAVTVIRLAAAQRVKVKVTKHGLTGAMAIIRLLEGAGIACVLGHVFEMGLAAAAEAHLGLAASKLILPMRDRLAAADGQHRRHRQRRAVRGAWDPAASEGAWARCDVGPRGAATPERRSGDGLGLVARRSGPGRQAHRAADNFQPIHAALARSEAAGRVGRDGPASVGAADAEIDEVEHRLLVARIGEHRRAHGAPSRRTIAAR